MKKILITDVTLRDAHQSLLATRMKTEDMLPIAQLMDQIGFFSLEVWGGATFDTSIRYLNEDPWERLKRLRLAFPKTRLQMLLRGQNLVGYRHYADDLVETFVFEAAENGIDIFRIFDALNDLRNIEKAVESVKKVGRHAQGTISYTVSPVHTIQTYVENAKRLKDMGVDSICIKDMAGLLLPEITFDLVKAIKEAVDLPLALHSHSTSGVSVATLLKGIEAGADIIDTAISSMSMQTSHSPTEAMVACLRDTPYDTGFDLENLDNIAKYFKKVRTKYAEFETSTIVDTEIFLYQVPGGMLSNFESQLKQQNAGDKLDEVLREISVVRKDFGYPPLVTPTSQIVGTQAVVNVMAGERYKTLTTESKNLLIGNYGKCPAEPNQELVKRSLKELGLEKPVTMRPADLLKPELDNMIAKTKEALNKSQVTMEDVLTYALFPNIAPQYFTNRNNPEPPKAPEVKQKTAVAEEKKVNAYLVNVDGHEFRVVVRSVDESLLTNLETLPPLMQLAPLAKQVQPLQQAAPAKQDTEPAAAEQPAAAPAKTAGGHQIKSPVTGTVLRILKNTGDSAAEGDVLLMLEAMKVEFEIKTGKAGKVTCLVKQGDVVQADAVLCEIS